MLFRSIRGESATSETKRALSLPGLVPRRNMLVLAALLGLSVGAHSLALPTVLAERSYTTVTVKNSNKLRVCMIFDLLGLLADCVEG